MPAPTMAIFGFELAAFAGRLLEISAAPAAAPAP
jgi:hypothetical protein